MSSRAPDQRQCIRGAGSLTERARREICRRVGRDLDTVALVAREFGVGWFCAHQAVIDRADALIAADQRIERVTGLGVDEHTVGVQVIHRVVGGSFK